MSYRLGRPPLVVAEQKDLLDYINRELEQIQLAFSLMEFLKLKKCFEPPSKPREGMVVYADGVSWNPGSGGGFYGYHGGSWTKF